MEETVNLLRTQKHDYMNHLQVILMQVSKGNNESARDYILSMSNNIGNNDVYYNTGNDYIDAALNIKKSRAIKYNIELTACVDSSLEDIELLESELNAIILNILDNSIEELKNSKKEYKYVHLDIYKEDKYHNISVKNNGRKIEDTNKIFEMGYSSKGNNRGYGLYAIKKLLKSYNCNIEVYSDEEETEFAIQVPIRT
nr:GHKL domain-containing protein [Clostridium sp. CCUG 7971]